MLYLMLDMPLKELFATEDIFRVVLEVEFWQSLFIIGEIPT